MAPPQHPFPVGALEQRVQYHTVDFKEKSRKLGDFDLKRDCTLLELVQYSCTTPEEQTERLIANPHADIGMECHPFVRLFRKYVSSHISRKYDSLLTRYCCTGAKRTAKYSTSKQRRGKVNMHGNNPQIHDRQQV